MAARYFAVGVDVVVACWRFGKLKATAAAMSTYAPTKPITTTLYIYVCEWIDVVAKCVLGCGQVVSKVYVAAFMAKRKLW